MKLSDLIESNKRDDSYKAYDNIINLNEDVMEDGIDGLEPGLICVLNFTNRIDDGNESKIKVHGLIKSKRTSKPETDPWPVYDVYFWTNYNSGEYSGAILLKDVCIWRFLELSKPSEKFLKSAKSGDLNDLLDDPNTLHYFDGDDKIYINKEK